MAVIRAQITFEMDSLNPKDRCVNTLHFFTLADPVTVAAEITTDIKNAFEFFEAYYTSDMANGAANFMKLYDLTDPEPRAPFYETTMAAGFTPAGGASLPAECALCVSYQALRISGQPQARRRGRFYLGPLGAAAHGTDGRPASAARTAAAAVGSHLKTQSVASGNYNWVVYSRVGGEGGGFADVNNGWVDNAYDTQRRRGLAPTSKLAF